MEKDLLTVKELAEKFRMSPKSVQQAYRKGTTPGRSQDQPDDAPRWHQSPESLREEVNVSDEPQPRRVSIRGDVERSCKSNNSLKLWIVNGEPAGTRTQGPRLKSSKRPKCQWLDFAKVSPFILR
jgi:hypothetical protein